jgi:hypothetical protein
MTNITKVSSQDYRLSKNTMPLQNRNENKTAVMILELYNKGSYVRKLVLSYNAYENWLDMEILFLAKVALRF